MAPRNEGRIGAYLFDGRILTLLVEKHRTDPLATIAVRWRGLASPFRRHLVAAPADPKLPAGVALPAYMQWWQTWTLQTLRHLQTLINVASKADDPDVAYRILREMIGVIKNVEPPKPRPDQHAFKRPSHLRSVK